MSHHLPQTCPSASGMAAFTSVSRQEAMSPTSSIQVPELGLWALGSCAHSCTNHSPREMEDIDRSKPVKLSLDQTTLPMGGRGMRKEKTKDVDCTYTPTTSFLWDTRHSPHFMDSETEDQSSPVTGWCSLRGEGVLPGCLMSEILCTHTCLTRFV